jgi:hypothetical protein
MRALLVAIALITSLCSTAITGPKEEALQVLEQWTTAFRTHRREAVTRPDKSV